MTSLVPAHTLRLSPIERPRSLLVRCFNWIFRRQFGKAMMPSRVIYARMPTLLWRTMPLYHLFDRGLSLDKDLRHLIEVQVSILNGCSFCEDLHRATALRTRMPADKLDALAAAGPSEHLNARERAALRYVTEIATTGASDDAFAQLAACFSEREIVEITWLSAFTTYLNRLAVPLGIGSDGFCAIALKQ